MSSSEEDANDINSEIVNITISEDSDKNNLDLSDEDDCENDDDNEIINIFPDEDSIDFDEKNERFGMNNLENSSDNLTCSKRPPNSAHGGRKYRFKVPEDIKKDLNTVSSNIDFVKNLRKGNPLSRIKRLMFQKIVKFKTVAVNQWKKLREETIMKEVLKKRRKEDLNVDVTLEYTNNPQDVQDERSEIKNLDSEVDIANDDLKEMEKKGDSGDIGKVIREKQKSELDSDKHNREEKSVVKPSNEEKELSSDVDIVGEEEIENEPINVEEKEKIDSKLSSKKEKKTMTVIVKVESIASRTFKNIEILLSKMFSQSNTDYSNLEIKPNEEFSRKGRTRSGSIDLSKRNPHDYGMLRKNNK